MDGVKAIADAVMYEGFVLWPYRPSALKNQQRWTFGRVVPPSAEHDRYAEPSRMQAQCLVRAGDTEPRIEVTVRFLQVVHRQACDVDDHPVDALDAGDRRHLTWDEAVEREISVSPGPDRRRAMVPIEIENGESVEEVSDSGGSVMGSLRRGWDSLAGTVSGILEPWGDGLWRITVEIANTGPPASRHDVDRRSFVSTHMILRTDDGAFVSAIDPPPGLEEHTERCQNVGCWPVLVGEEGTADTMLAAPIILPDHPRIAPESPGDLFDGGEIDELLTLNILALTDDEQREMANADPRTAAILARSRSLGEDLLGLHGTFREGGTG